MRSPVTLIGILAEFTPPRDQALQNLSSSIDSPCSRAVLKKKTISNHFQTNRCETVYFYIAAHGFILYVAGVLEFIFNVNAIEFSTDEPLLKNKYQSCWWNLLVIACVVKNNYIFNSKIFPIKKGLVKLTPVVEARPKRCPGWRGLRGRGPSARETRCRPRISNFEPH